MFRWEGWRHGSYLRVSGVERGDDGCPASEAKADYSRHRTCEAGATDLTHRLALRRGRQFEQGKKDAQIWADLHQL